jgi:methyltransferase-like protein
MSPDHYDELPYWLLPLVESHPRRLHAIAHLHGLTAVSPNQARVLELGCAVGGNIVPMAYTLPGSQFVGVDLSQRQIRDAKTFAEGSDVRNLDLRCVSIMDVTPQWGQFDYIIVHGVFSWVPPEVREKILQICGEQLSPRGVAYISFNCYPGSHARMWVREAMLFHVQNVKDPHARAQAAREFLIALNQSPFMSDDKKAVLASEGKYIHEKPNSYIAHEYLETYNDPMYFHEFASQAQRHGMQYLADALYNSLLADQECAESRKWQEDCGGDIVRAEQYSDFVHGRAFRRSLLCRNQVRLDQSRMQARLRETFAVGYVQPKAHGGGYTRFEHLSGSAHISGSRGVFEALTSISRRFPEPAPLGEWLSRPDGKEIALAILKCWGSGMVELYREPPVFCTSPGPRPRASALARHLSQHSTRLINLRHENLEVHNLHRRVVSLLDATRTPEQVATQLNTPLQDVERALATLAKAAFIEA